MEWCACFVSWCANECGYIDSGIIPKHAVCNDGLSWFKSKDQFKSGSSSYIPKAGDIIYFNWDGDRSARPHHVGIVQSSDVTTVYTIEGNSGNAVRQNTYSINSSFITGYGTPNYPSSLGGNTNAEKAWNFFISKGCNAYAAAGILGNLQQESGMDPTKYQSNGPGRGIAQWTVNSDRWNNLLAYASLRGTDWTDLETQLEFIWYELNGGEATTAAILKNRYGGIENFKNASSISWAVEAFEKSFERAGTPNMSKRISYAESFYNQFS